MKKLLQESRFQTSTFDWLAAFALALVLVGCATSSTPTAFERKFFDVQTNYVPHVELVTHYLTNTVPVTNYLQVTSTVTNQVGVTVPVTNFVPVTAYQTNVVSVSAAVTNQTEQYTLTPNATAKATAAVTGTASNLAAPGIGGLVSSGVLGIFGLWASYRNRQFAKKNDVLSQSAGALAQIIETAREVMSTTPQGTQAANALTQWMVGHQAETGTITAISNIVKSSVDNEEAQKAASEILALIGQPVTVSAGKA